MALNSKYLYNLLTRVVLALIVTLNFELFYTILTPVTVYTSYFILNLFYDVTLLNYLGDNVLGISGVGYRFIRACIAGAAYYLIFILIIGIKNLEWKKGLKMFVVGSLLILAMNIIRILILIYVGVEFGKNYFDAIHLIFWNFVSGIYLALVWIFLVYKFKVDKIPFLEDIKYLYKSSLLKKRE